MWTIQGVIRIYFHAELIHLDIDVYDAGFYNIFAPEFELTE